jgi:hypothetical protein
MRQESKHAEEAIDVLEDWAADRSALDEAAGEEADPLVSLFVRARGARVELTDQEAANVLAAVRRGLGASGASGGARRWTVWAAAAAVLLALAASLQGVRPRSRPGPPREVVKQVSFEAEHEGRVVRFEMVLHRTERKEKADAAEPDS